MNRPHLAPPPGHRARWQRSVLVGALVLLASLYGLYLAIAIAAAGLFNYVGMDYRVYWASADIARSQGFAAVYDLAIQERYQRQFYDMVGTRVTIYEIVPMPYLPPFVALFLPLLLLPPTPGFYAWTAFWAIVLVGYVWWFTRRVATGRRDLAIAVALSLPAFGALLAGQTDIWLLVCLGEFVIASTRGQSLRAGLWLGGLLLKPQTLLLLAPWLLLSRQGKALTGFAAVGAVLLALSVALAGPGGVLAQFRLITQYASGVETNYPESMMNWRAVGVNLAASLDPRLAWGLAAAGMAATAALVLPVLFARAPRQPTRRVLSVAALYAATSALAWHAHVYTALPLAIPLTYLVATGYAPRALLFAWATVPGWLFLLTAFASGSPAAHHVGGFTLLVLNVAIVAWATAGRSASFGGTA